MSENLQADLINEFVAQKDALGEQITLLDPLVNAIHQPAYKRILNSSLSVILEVVLWLLAIGCIVLAFFYGKVYPLSIIRDLMQSGYNLKNQIHLTQSEINMAGWIVQGFLIFIGILFIIIARMMAKVRNKNAILQLTAKNMKQISTNILKRKGALEVLAHRYSDIFPSDIKTPTTPSLNNNIDQHFDNLS